MGDGRVYADGDPGLVGFCFHHRSGADARFAAALNTLNVWDEGPHHMGESLGDAAQVRAIIEQAVRATHEIEGSTRDFITRAEFGRDMEKLEQRLEIRLENAMLKTRNWVLGGIIASSVLFGGGFLSMMSRFDRTAEAVLGMQRTLETGRDWIDESDARDRRQDEAIEELKPDYEAAPFETRVR